LAPIAVLPNPSAAANTIRDRTANAFALFDRRAHPSTQTAHHLSLDRRSGMDLHTATLPNQDELLTHDTSGHAR
jgi:hypothetical protein